MEGLFGTLGNAVYHLDTTTIASQALRIPILNSATDQHIEQQSWLILTHQTNYSQFICRSCNPHIFYTH